VKKTGIKLPLHKYGMLDAEALFALPLIDQRRLLSELNKQLGPFDYEKASQQARDFRKQMDEIPPVDVAASKRRHALQTDYLREIEAPREAQRMLAAEFVLRGAAAGRQKGARTKKDTGAGTAAKISHWIQKIGKPLTTRGLAGEIAKRLQVDRSTVSRHLKALTK
jgi:DNA-binding transcriptional ArsR family regulator